MSRTTTTCFGALALFLVLFPLALAKPGLPLTLKGDEPAYYLMALSLAHDRDLRCEVRDIERLADEFPYNQTQNLILGSSDGWHTLYFGKPYLVSFLAALPTALFGANGFVAMNMALLLLSVWLGALWLRRSNPDATALLFSAGFFLLSNAFAYVFWLHTEILCIASVTACLYFGLTPHRRALGTTRLGRLGARLWSEQARLALSGAALVLGAYNKPYLALLGLPVVVRAWSRSGARGAASWVAGVALITLAVCGLSVALIGQPTPYLGLARAGVTVENLGEMPELPGFLTAPRPTAPGGAPGSTAPTADEAPINSFVWILDSFQVNRDTWSNLGFFFVGRHTGLFPYAPFSLLALGLFFTVGPRDREQWLLLACLLGVALYSLTFIWFNWHGGGGFVGNRYFVNALPGFLFLVGRIVPNWLPAVGYALGGLFVGGIIFTPFGAAVEAPTLQAHTRNLPFRLLPFEHTLARNIPGYRGMPGADGSHFWGRADQFRPVNGELWVVGGQRVELELRTNAPVERPVFEIETFVAPNRVRLELGGARIETRFESVERPGNVTHVVLEKPRAGMRPTEGGMPIAVYPLELRIDRQVWRREEVEYKKGGVFVLVGAAVTYLGDESDLNADLYSIEWAQVQIPASWPAGKTLSVQVRVRNTSQRLWHSGGATKVALSYHWLGPDGSRVQWEGLRSPLPRDLAPGAWVTMPLNVETPKTPGRYVLALDPVRERIAWFSERREGQLLERQLEITAAAPAGL